VYPGHTLGALNMKEEEEEGIFQVVFVDRDS
jgi:hypothetical protein